MTYRTKKSLTPAEVKRMKLKVGVCYYCGCAKKHCDIHGYVKKVLWSTPYTCKQCELICGRCGEVIETAPYAACDPFGEPLHKECYEIADAATSNNKQTLLNF